MKVTLATGNLHKVEEINLIAKDYNIEFILPEGEFNPVEDGNNFIDNAVCKAKCAIKEGKTKYYLADDSGLCIDYLNGDPGIKSARYETTAQKRINKVLDKLKGIEERSAHFTCAMVVLDNKGNLVFKTQQYCFGSVAKEQKGQNGFGYDPIFFVDGENMTMAELSKERKAVVSHRAKALSEVLKWLKNN